MEFQFGDWLVSPEANLVSNGDAKTQLEPRVMAVLRYLCRHPGAVIPAEEILQACWGSNELGDNPVHKAITQLRRAFGDSSTEPRYIETIRKRGYRAIAPVVTFAAPPATTWEGGSPFRGLEAFQENHAAIFFGRVQATAQLRELVLTQAAHGCPMALVLGPSGSGKTSLVRAGLLPQLMAGAIRSDEPVGLSSTVYLDCADLGSGTLFQALAGALIDAEIDGEPLFPGASADSLGQRLTSDPDAIAAQLRTHDCQRLAVGVFVDRVEAIFRAQPSEADRFMESIEALAKSNCLLLLMACRNDFYPEVMAQPVLLALKSRGGHFDVLPPDGADIAQIVRQPALAAHLTFERDETTGASLDDVLCDAARGNPDMLPLLQYTLNELYRQRGEKNVLKFDVYRQLGGIEGAVGVRAEEVVSQLNSAQIGALPYVLSLLINIGEEQSAVTSRRSPFSMLQSDDQKELVRVMVEARLFVSELLGDVPSFGVAHEALLRRWPRVVDWIERHRNALQLRTRIFGQAVRWEAQGKPTDLLIPAGSQVSQAAELLQLSDFSLSTNEKEYVRASITRSKFGERIRLGVMGLIALLAVAATVLGVTARSAQEQAERNRTEAESLMTYMLGEFVDKLRPLGRLDLLDGVSGKALNYLSSIETSESSSTALRQRAKALQVIAEVNSSRSKPEQAEEALQASRRILETLDSKNNADKELLKDLGANAFWIGQIYLNKREWNVAEQQFRAYLAYSERMGSIDPNDSEGWIEQSYAHSNLGTVNTLRGNLEMAAESYAKSVDLKKKASSARPDEIKLRADTANTLAWLADTQTMLGKLSLADQLNREAVSLLVPIHDKAPGENRWAAKLGSALWRQAVLERALGRDEDAANHLAQAVALYKTITKQDPSNLQWQSSLFVIEHELLTVKVPIATASKAIEDYLRRLGAQIASDPKRRELILLENETKIDLANSYSAQGNFALALKTLEGPIEALTELFARDKLDALFASTLANALLLKADVLHLKGSDAEARKACELAAATIAPVATNTNYFSNLVPLTRAKACLHDNDTLSLRKKLQSMSFRDSRHIKVLNPPTERGK